MNRRPSSVNEVIQWKGCITTAKYIRGRTTAELERDLGFRRGRLDGGAFVGIIVRKPKIDEFKLLGYSNVPEDLFKPSDKLDANKLKRMVMDKVWKDTGPDQPVKIFPVNGPLSNDNSLEYPSGWGVPQWKLTRFVDFKIVAHVIGSEKVYW